MNHQTASPPLRDFSIDWRVWLLTAVAVPIGAGAAGLAAFLLASIRLATQIFYYHRFSFEAATPAGSQLGPLMPLMPVVGGLLIGLMARYGSDKIRGHAVDPLETVCVAEVMIASIDGLPPTPAAYSDETCREVAERMAAGGHTMLPVVHRATGQLCGAINMEALLVGRGRAFHREQSRTRAFRPNST